MKKKGSLLQKSHLVKNLTRQKSHLAKYLTRQKSHLAKNLKKILNFLKISNEFLLV